MSEEDIVEDILSKLSAMDYEYLRRVPKRQLIELHHSTGRNIRNDYKLWAPGNPHVTEGSNDDNHPDQMSMRIIETVWEKVNAAPK